MSASVRTLAEDTTPEKIFCYGVNKGGILGGKNVPYAMSGSFRTLAEDTTLEKNS